MDLIPTLYPSSFLLRAGLGLLLGVAVGGVGAWRRALTPSGAIAAALVGAVVFTLGGWAWALLIVAFFISSSLLSFYRAKQKEERQKRGARRDIWQVLANGGWLTLLAVVAYLRPAWHDPWLFPAAVGTLAAVTADTWATELGLLSPVPPRMVTSGAIVPPGTNGGITRIGTFSAITGGLLIGFLAGVFALLGSTTLYFRPGWLTLIGGIAGFGGALFDSLLGATVQRVYWCPTCQHETEESVHRCGTTTEPRRGWSWLDNDMVNFLASVVGSLLGILVTLGLATAF